MKEPGNVVTSTTGIAPRLDGTTEIYGECHSKIRVVLPISNPDVIDVLNGWIESVLIVTVTPRRKYMQHTSDRSTLLVSRLRDPLYHPKSYH